ncbi:hypothetical protein [Salipiger mucosus]|uniref:Uncharacterized protein n=1 Tax=Salipiger mucosus DSM 16094 TaxID=1123237 RepID=S9RVP8_9RHOB|nr:hypothetical protein [Salipiger mucosus]EPX78054.1 hypothetical protein Salmuc_03376 [Salipiger mucosus DSM 16094]
MTKTSLVESILYNPETAIYRVSGIQDNALTFSLQDDDWTAAVERGLFRHHLVIRNGHARERIFSGRHRDAVSFLYVLRSGLYHRQRDREEREKTEYETELHKQADKARRDKIWAVGLVVGPGLCVLAVSLLAVIGSNHFQRHLANTETDRPATLEAAPENTVPDPEAIEAPAPIRTISADDISGERLKSYLEDGDPVPESEAPRYEAPVPEAQPTAADDPEDAPTPGDLVKLAPREEQQASPSEGSEDILQRFYGNAGAASQAEQGSKNLTYIWESRKDDTGISDIPAPDTFTGIRGEAKLAVPGGGNVEALSEMQDFGMNARGD